MVRLYHRPTPPKKYQTKEFLRIWSCEEGNNIMKPFQEFTDWLKYILDLRLSHRSFFFFFLFSTSEKIGGACHIIAVIGSFVLCSSSFSVWAFPQPTSPKMSFAHGSFKPLCLFLPRKQISATWNILSSLFLSNHYSSNPVYPPVLQESWGIKRKGLGICYPCDPWLFISWWLYYILLWIPTHILYILLLEEKTKKNHLKSGFM